MRGKETIVRENAPSCQVFYPRPESQLRQETIRKREGKEIGKRSSTFKGSDHLDPSGEPSKKFKDTPKKSLSEPKKSLQEERKTRTTPDEGMTGKEPLNSRKGEQRRETHQREETLESEGRRQVYLFMEGGSRRVFDNECHPITTGRC